MNILLSTIITSYFTVHLSNVMGYSENTIKSYRDTFVLLFNYAEEKHLCSKGRISIDIFKQENIIAFLDWLEVSRNASISTRNQRLAALKSFSKYASTKAIEYLDIFQQVLNIKPKKGISKAVCYLSVDSIALLLKQPESDTKNGIRDLALLSLLYESGCRVQELIDIKFGNLSLTVPATISVTGKGEKYELSH